MPQAPKHSKAGRHPQEVLLGKISGVFGFRGEVRLYLDNPEYAWLEEPREVFLKSPAGEMRTVRLRARSGAGRRILGAIEGVTDEASARALMGWTISARWKDVPAAGRGEWFLADILGMRIVTDKGRLVGEIVEVHQNGHVDVWEVQGALGTCYVPLLEENIVEVGEDGIVVVDGAVVLDDVE